jgi:hypothetical protein
MFTIIVFTLLIGVLIYTLYAALASERAGWNSDTLIPVIIVSASVLLMMSLLFSTKYKISGHNFMYTAGPINGSIDIHQITKIKTNTTSYVGMKPALSAGGMILYYNKYDEIYISPKSPDSFIEVLQAINPSIKIE